nr:T9SS type A sorting domain-containing protein [Pseudozobellia thermophila]
MEKNPVVNGTASFRLVNQPEDVVFMGINLHDSQGRLMNNYRVDEINMLNDDTYQISVDGLPDGLYFVRIATNKGKVLTLKLLIDN